MGTKDINRNEKYEPSMDLDHSGVGKNEKADKLVKMGALD